MKSARLVTPKGFRIERSDEYGPTCYFKGEVGVIGSRCVTRYRRATGIPGQPDQRGWQLAEWTKNGWREIGGMEESPLRAVEAAKEKGL